MQATQTHICRGKGKERHTLRLLLSVEPHWEFDPKTLRS